MKRGLFLLFFSFTLVAFSQQVQRIDVVEKSNDVTVIAAFVKANPTHPKVPMLKRRMATLMSPTGAGEASAKPTVKPLNTDKMAKTVNKNSGSGQPSAQNQKTAELLTHIFNNDPNRKEAYVRIINKSKCRLVVKLSGKKFYNLDVPANNDNYILVPKGKYVITTSVCDAKYSSSKDISQDVEITLKGK